MPNMRRVDDSAGQPQRAQEAGVREPSQVHYPRKRREDWPFKFYEENGKIYENYGPRRKQRPNLDDVEEALL